MKIDKRLRLWRRVKEAVAFDRAEISADNDPLYRAVRKSMGESTSRPALLAVGVLRDRDGRAA
jgi:hypothetical protein